MKEEIVRIQRDALARIAQASDRRGVEDARVAILGKKGELTLAQTGMKNVPREEKPAVGQLLNEARKAITEALDAKLEEVQAQADKAAVAGVDLTLPARSLPSGGLHPAWESQRELFDQFPDDVFLGGGNGFLSHPVTDGRFRHETSFGEPCVVEVVGLEPQLDVHFQLILIHSCHASECITIAQ